MKLTLQLIVVVLITPSKFRDNLQQFVQIHSLYNSNIQGRKQEMPFSPNLVPRAFPSKNGWG